MHANSTNIFNIYMHKDYSTDHFRLAVNESIATVVGIPEISALVHWFTKYQSRGFGITLKSMPLNMSWIPHLKGLYTQEKIRKYYMYYNLKRINNNTTRSLQQSLCILTKNITSREIEPDLISRWVREQSIGKYEFKVSTNAKQITLLNKFHGTCTFFLIKKRRLGLCIHI